MKLFAAEAPGERPRAIRLPPRSWLLPPALLLLLALGLMLIGAAFARPGVDLRADDPGVGRTLVRFHGIERNPTDTYRWSGPLAGVFLYGYEGRPAIVTLRLASPRPADAPPAVARARSGDVELGSFPVAADWRQYHILAPTRPAGESALLLALPAFTPADDPRELGVALSAVRVQPAGPGGLQPVRTLYLLALPLLGWLLTVRLAHRSSFRPRPPASEPLGMLQASSTGSRGVRHEARGALSVPRRIVKPKRPTPNHALDKGSGRDLRSSAAATTGQLPHGSMGAAGLWAKSNLVLALVVGALLAGVTGWATAFPTASGYWLPTLGWPWWPALPLLVLIFAPQLAQGWNTTWGWLSARPPLGWAGLGIALAALVGMRVGLPVPVGVSLLAIGVLVGLTRVIDERLSPHVSERRAWAPAPALLGLLALALFLRLYNLGGQPAGLWRDESRHGLLALRIWSDPTFRPVYVVEGADLPALLFYLMAPVVGLLGPEAANARLVSAIAGALTPLALYWAAGPLIGRRAALAAAALAAWASWSLSMSRWAFPATLDHLLVLTAVGLVWRSLPEEPGLDDRRPTIGSYRLAAMSRLALAGGLGGLAMYAYHTGRVAPLALAAVAAIRLGWAPGAWRRALPGLVAMVLAGALTVAPLAAYILGDSEGYNRRVGNVGILDSNDPATHTPAGLVLGNLGRYALAYHARGDANGRHHMPLAPFLDPVTGLLLAVGLGLAVSRARRSAGLAAVLALGAVYLVPGVLSGNAPHAMRSLGTLAPACMLAGLGLAALIPRRTAGDASGRRPLVLVVGVLSVSLAFNVWLYFGVMRAEPEVYGEFDLVETAMGRVARAPIEATDPDLRAVQVYLPDKLRAEDTVRFLTWTIPVGSYTGAALPPDGPALVLLPASASPAEQAAALAALGPNAVPLGPVPTYPGTERPIVLAFGRGEAAGRLLLELEPVWRAQA